MPRIVQVEHLGELRLRLRFTDGLERDLDFAGALDGAVLEPLNDPALFARAGVDPVAGTVTWPNGVDLDPDVLHGDHEPAGGRAPTLLAERRISATS